MSEHVHPAIRDRIKKFCDEQNNAKIVYTAQQNAYRDAYDTAHAIIEAHGWEHQLASVLDALRALVDDGTQCASPDCHRQAIDGTDPLICGECAMAWAEHLHDAEQDR